MMYSQSFLIRGLTYVLLLVAAGSLSAASPTLGVAPLGATGVYRLWLQGESGVRYVLEQSQDLSTWEVDQAAQAPTNGLIEWTNTVDEQTVGMFYRAHVEDPAEAPASVTAELDTELSVQGIAAEEGGELSLVDHDGTVYTLLIPPNAVAEPTVISMTIATNLIGYPLDAGDWRAVVFQPQGLEFAIPAQLQIDRTEPTSTNDQVSFWFAEDGTDFGLVPNQVSSNTVVWPVHHFSGYGTGGASRTSLSSQMKRRVADPFQRLSQQIAGELTTARSEGLTPQTSMQLPAKSELKIAQAAADTIRRLFPDNGRKLASDCGATQASLNRVAWLLGLDKANGLKSPAYKDAAEPLRSAICAGLNRCFADYLSQCKNGDAKAYGRFLKLKARREATLGLSCGSPLDEAVFEIDFNPCRPGWSGFAWTGHIQQSSNTINQPFNVRQDRQKLRWTFRGEVFSFDDQLSIPGLPMSYFKAELAGVLTADYQDVQHISSWGCEGVADRNAARRESMEIQSGVLSTNITLTLTYMKFEGSEPSIFVSSKPSLFDLPIKSRSFQFATDCFGKETQNQWSDGDQSSIGFALDSMSNPGAVFNIASDRISCNWTSSTKEGYWIWGFSKRP